MKIRPFLALLSSMICSAAFGQTGLANGGMESGSPGQAPPGWFVPPLVTDAGYTVTLSVENPKDGKQVLVISRASQQGQGFGNVMQSIDATPYRNKTVRFRAAVRYERGGGGGQTALWMRVDRTNGQQGFFDNMGNRPITSSSWAFYDIVGRIDADAESINVGMMLVGGGRAFLDSATLTLSDAATEPVVKPRALTDRGLQNLIAYSKLYGYVRHFHPSDAVEKADWNRLSSAGILAVEDASGPAELAQKLEAFFKPIAPSVKVFATGTPPAADSATGQQVVSWENIGYGFGGGPGGGIYQSKRVFKAASGALPAPFVADLGGGVSAQVPLTLFAASNSSLPKSQAPDEIKGILSNPTGDDRTTRLADVVIAWNIFQHFYPYFDVVKTDWDAQLPIALKAAATDPDSRSFLTTLRRLVGSAKDGHGHVVHSSDQAYALPPFLAAWVEGKFVVTVVDPSMTKIKAGDEILKIGGKTVEALWAETEPLISGATEQWRRHRGEIELLRGPLESSVQIEARTGSGQPYTITVPRGASDLKEKRPKAIEELKLGIWYVDLDTARANMEEYKKALPSLASAEGIIFDLRGYPNEVAMDVIPRLAKVPTSSALWNTPRVTKPDHKDMEFVKGRWPERAPEVPRFRGKVAFITDGRAISYAESIMGIIENYKLGPIVGEATAGTNGNINQVLLPGGYMMIFTGMKVLKHDGSVHHGVGIQPTVPTKRTIAGVAAGKDELLEKAISIMRG